MISKAFVPLCCRASIKVPLLFVGGLCIIYLMRHPILLLLLLMLAAPAHAQESLPVATGISYGLSVKGALDDGTPRNVYAFSGLRGEVVTITVQVTGGDLDPMLAVMSNKGDLLARVDDGPPFEAAGATSGPRDLQIQTLRLPESDRYYVVVGRFGFGLGSTSGDYTVEVDRIGVSSANGSALRYGDSIVNRISPGTPQLYYSFQAARGDIVNISMQRISGNLDSFLQVTDSNGVVLASDDEVPNSGSLDAEISNLAIPQDGLYVIVASRFGQAAGTSEGGFYLTVQESKDSGVGNSPQAPLPLMPNIPLEGDVTSDHIAQYYRFEAKAGDIVSVTMEKLTGNLDSYLALLDGTGNQIAANDDAQDGSQNAGIDNFYVLTDGQYTVIATRNGGDQGKGAGRFRLTLTTQGNAAKSISPDVRFIPYGSTLTGNIDDTTTEILYAFFGHQGDVITVSMNRADGDLDPYLAILDGGQKVLTYNDDTSDGTQNAVVYQYVLPGTGVFYIQATRFTGEGKPLTRGSYTLVLAQIQVGG